MRKLGLWLSLCVIAPAAQAAAYVFPGNLPAGCSGSGPSYTCSGLTLNSGDTVTINTPRPATITVNGALNATGASINSGGSAANLTLNVSGAVTLTTSSIVGNVNSVGATLNTGSSITGNLAAGAATITMWASTTVSGNVSCTTTCYLNMSANDISIGGTTTVGYLYNSGYLRARFGGTITASYAYIYIGNDATVTGNVVLNATHATSYGVYLGDRSVVSGSISSAQTGGIQLNGSSQVNGNVSITNATAGGTGVSSNNITMYAAAKVLGNVACSNCQLDLQGNNTEVGGTTSVGTIGNPNNYTSYSGAKFGSLLVSPSGNTVNATGGQILLGNTTTANGGIYASQAITTGTTLNVTGSVTAGGAVSIGATSLVTGNVVATGAVTLGNSNTVNGSITSSSSLSTGTSTVVQGSISATGSVTMGATAAVTGSLSAGAGVSLGTGSSVGQNLSGGNGTVTLTANNSVGGDVSCTTTCYLNMSANDISIGGTTTVGYLYNSGYLRARFGGTITASYAYIYIGNDATVTGNVVLNATHATSYGVYLGDRSVVSGNISSAQTGGIQLNGSSQVNGNVSITNATAGGTGVSSNNITMYAAAKVLGNVACSNCQLDLQGNSTDVGGTTSVGTIGNPNNYTSYSGAKFGSLLVAPSGNTVNASNGVIYLGNGTTAKGGIYASQAINTQATLNVTGSVTAGGAISLGATASITGDLVSSSNINTSNNTTVQGSVTAAGSVTMGTTALITGGVTAGSGVTLAASSSVGQNLSGGNGTVTLNASTSIAGNVSCTTTCYLNMSANDISIGGTTTVGYLYNSGYLRARFGGTITASYAYIYIGNDATVTGNVVLNATHATSYGVYLGDRSVVSGSISSAQTGGIQLNGSSQVNGNVSITNATAGGTGQSNNIYMYAAAKVLGNVACSNCQLDLQGNNTEVGGTTSVGTIGNPNNYTSYSGAKFGSLLVAPSGNTVNASNGVIYLGNGTTAKGGIYASQAINTQATLNVTGSVTAGGAISLGATASITGDLVSSSNINTSNNTTVQGSVTAAGSVTMGTTALITGGVTAGSGVTLAASSSVGQNLSGGNGTVTLNASTSIAGNVSCTTTCYLNMSANDISIGGTTTVGYLYNSGYLRARFGGTITASYAYIYIGNDAVVNGDVKLNATYATSYGVYVGDRSVVNGTVSTAQTGGIQMNTSSTAQCARTLSSGTITLSASARPAGVCCASAGFGASCNSSCVSNSSGLTMPTGCRAQEAFLGEVARYQFEETAWTTGGTVQDSSGYERHGTITGSPTQARVVPPTCGTTYGVFAAGQRIKVPYNAAFNPASFTVAHWARVDGGTNSFRGSVTSRTGASSVTGYNLYAGSGNNWQFWTGSPTSGFQSIQGPAVSNGVWTHVAVTYQVTSGPDGSGVYTGNAVLYVNGASAGTYTGMRYKPNTSSPLVIGSGGNEDLDFSQYPFIGALDDVRVFDYALSAAQVAALRTANCPGGLPGSVWWSRANTISQSDNTAVSSWSNEVDTTKNLSPSTVAPKFRNSNALNINFNPVVEFTSTTATDVAAQYFRSSSLLGSKTWARSHVALVGYPRNNTQSNFIFWEQTVTPVGYAEGRFSGHVPWLNEIFWDAGNCCSTNRIRVTDTTTVNAPSVYLFHMDTTSASPGGVKQGIRRNGLLLGSASAPTSFTGQSAEFRLGFRGPSAVNDPFQGVLSEGMLFLGQAMTDSLATQLESYLSVKYGITLGGNGAAATSYAHSGGATTWSAGTGFHNNVTGLGRDDATKLSQLISRSSNTGAQITLTTGATMPSTATAVAPTSGVAFSADRSFVMVGDNGLSLTATAYIAAGPQAGRARSARVWRAQVTGTVPTQMAVCIPESMIPAEFLGGNAASDLWLTTASSADFANGAASFTMTATNCVASGVGVTDSVAGRLAVLPSATLQAWGGVGYFTVSRRLLDHLEITANSSSGVTCAPTSYTIKACADAACTSLYTGGVSGTLTLSGSGLTVNFPAGAGFSIPSGSSQATVSAQVITPGTATVGVTGLSITPGNTQNVFCGLGATAAAGTSCAMTVADAGLLFDVPHHRSGATQTITLSAVKKADSSLACKPAFTGAKSVNFKCEYLNPGTGTRPVLVSGVGLNAAAVTTSACDATGANRTLTFDANGQTTTTVQYLDVGQVKLSASWTGTSGGDNGLSLRGDDSFIAAPYTFAVQPSSSSQVAGVGFGVTVTAANAANDPVPNFGREAVPERPTLTLYRAKPSGTAAQDGVFSTGTAGPLSGGAQTFSGVAWSEVGRADVAAKLNSGSYLGTGYSVFATTGSWVFCASQGGTCTLPAGVTSTVSFDAGSAGFSYRHGAAGEFSCSAGSFAIDPAPSSAKVCWYTVETGAHTNSTGTLVFKPHHFDVTTAAACGSFSYAAQLFTTTVTARNAQGGVTRNYDGSGDTNPNFAKTVNMSLASANATGALSSSVAPSSFVAGVGATMSSFSFVNKLTPEQTISLRATDTDGVSSNTFAEGSMVLRSGRLVLSNAFGSEKSPLQIPMQLQYWSGKSWVLNSSDTCTVISPNSVVRAQTLNHNNSNASWTSAVSGVSLAGGSGFITLGAPSGGGTGSVDLAVNLGVGPASADLSCLASHPNSTGAGLPWLRSRQGSCASTFDRDPSARATFGIYAPETKRSVHVREVF